MCCAKLRAHRRRLRQAMCGSNSNRPLIVFVLTATATWSVVAWLLLLLLPRSPPSTVCHFLRTHCCLFNLILLHCCCCCIWFSLLLSSDTPLVVKYGLLCRASDASLTGSSPGWLIGDSLAWLNDWLATHTSLHAYKQTFLHRENICILLSLDWLPEVLVRQCFGWLEFEVPGHHCDD